jgi:hypothetical protein
MATQDINLHPSWLDPLQDEFDRAVHGRPQKVPPANAFLESRGTKPIHWALPEPATAA